MPSELFFNDPGTTLAALCNVGDTSITVSTYFGYPSTGNFRIKIDNEIMLVTAITGNTTWTVTRAQESTSAASHSVGAVVNHVFSGGGITQGMADRVADGHKIGTFANLPASPRLGETYKCTDSGYDAIYDGSSWRFFFGSSIEVFPPQRTNTFNTWVNQGSATVTTTNGTLVLTATGTGGDQFRVYGKTAPSFPFTVECAQLWQHSWCTASNAGGFFSGISLYDGTKLMSFDVTHQWSGSSYAPVLEWLYFNTVTSFNSAIKNQTATFAPSVLWLKLVVTNTTARTLYVSVDGQTWTQFFTESSGLSFTPTIIGPGFNIWGPDKNGVTMNSDVYISWRVY